MPICKYPKIRQEAKLYYEVNTKLTIQTGMKAKKSGVKQFIFMSSAIVYGNSAPIGKMKMITEDSITSIFYVFAKNICTMT